MKLSFTIFEFVLAFLTYGQSNNDTIQVIAKLISSGQGSKIYIAEYEVLKTIKGTVEKDTIQVDYSNKYQIENGSEPVLLNLTTYTGNSKTKDYYIFPEYNAKKGIETIQISTVDFDYWEGCETGKGACKALTFARNLKKENWILFMPCGGTLTTVTLCKKQGTLKGTESCLKTEIEVSECPPIFDITDLTDGKYMVNMLACGLGGEIEINLKTGTR